MTSIEGLNRFIKLLVMTTDKGKSYLLLYGLSVPTEQACRPWKFVPKGEGKTTFGIIKCIMTAEQESHLLQNLSAKEPIQFVKYSLSAGLIMRSPVLANDSCRECRQPGPVRGVHLVTELWNVDKIALVQAIKDTLHINGKDLYRQMQDLFSWLSTECGIDFTQHGYRFGNFEQYTRPEYSQDFDVSVLEENGLKVTAIKKKRKIDTVLLVKCAAEHRGRWIMDCIKQFGPNEDVVFFEAQEPMSRVWVQIWNAESTRIMYSYDSTLVMNFQLSMSMKSVPKIIKDPWTAKLRSAARDQEAKIGEIETVTVHSNDRPIKIHNPYRTEIDSAMEEGNRVISAFRQQKCHGAFVPKVGKNGEIDSFLKIREYISTPSLDRIILADPFFSVESAAKLLARIPNSKVRVEIITSLGDVDPDTGNAVDACNQCKTFLQQNSAVLHQNLKVNNLKRGKEPVFHDRYLIRYHTSGEIDGFLLSNSINSAGRSYPFVVAPMEHEVCLSVCEYMDEMLDATKQAVIPKKDRIACEILFDKRKETPEFTRARTSELFTILKEHCAVAQTTKVDLYTRVQSWQSMESLHFAIQDLPHIITIIWSHWPKEKEQVLSAVGEAMGHTYCWTPNEFATEFLKIDHAAEEFKEFFTQFSRDMEREEDHVRRGIDSDEYRNWALLSGYATVSKQGLHLMIEDPPRVWYPTKGYLHGCYYLYLCLFPMDFVELMSATASPLMFGILTEYMALREWNPLLYRALISCQIIWIPALAALWFCSKYQKNDEDTEWVLTVLKELPPQDCLFQCINFLSRLTFCIRVLKREESSLERWQQLREELFCYMAEVLNHFDGWDKAVFDWLLDCESVSECELHLKLAKSTKNLRCRKLLLEKAAYIAKNDLESTVYPRECTRIICDLLQVLDALCEAEAESKILGEIVLWEVFELATEPYRQYYDYSRWYNACIRASWQIQLLQEYYRLHPMAEKTKSWLDVWCERIELSSMTC